ncbi:MAG: hypothetical protein WCI77_05655 [Candidatus Omnitrophota bacterium]
MAKITANRFIDAFFKLILLSAAVHIGIVIGRTITEGTARHLNYFKLISLDLILPSVCNGNQNHIIAFLVMVIVYYLIFLLFTKK